MPLLLYFSLVSASTQKMLTNMLQDESWTDSFLDQSERYLGEVGVLLCSVQLRPPPLPPGSHL